MGRCTLLFFALTICLMSYSILNAEAKSREKNKDKYNKKYKTEGSSQEAKHRYTKESAKYEQIKRKKEKLQEENIEPELEETEFHENAESQEQVGSFQKQIKEKKPYTISVELVEEAVPQTKTKVNSKKSSKITSEENSDIYSKVQNDSKPKTIKDKSNRGTKKSKSVKSTGEESSNIIVHVPKNKKGTRQVLVFQVQEEETFEEEDATGNAVQQYISEAQESINEEDCSCDEGKVEDESVQDEDMSNSMCYYGNKNK